MSSLSHDEKIRVVFSYQDLSITLRPPEMGDTRDCVIGVQRKFDMMGRQHTWIPVQRTAQLLILVFKALPREKVFELRDFLIATAGKVIKFLDFDEQKWLGRISTETPLITNEGDCRNTITIQFEGFKI